MNIDWKSPIWFVPVSIVLILTLIEGIHISQHDKYCKTEAQWMNEQEGMTYDRESQID